MKCNPWIFPGLATLIAGGWIGYQKNTAAGLQRDITILTERIHQVHASEENQLKSSKTEGTARQEKEKKIDWKDLATKMGQMRNGAMPDMRAMMRIQRMLMEMSAEDLAAQLDEIAKLDLDEAGRSQIESMILGALAEKDPKLALDRCADQLGGEDMSKRWRLAHAFGKWADKEPVAAAAWFDQLIKQGKFDSKSLDGKSESRLSFEGALVNALLQSDPRAASARVAALPDDQRQDFFQQGFAFGGIKPGTEAAYAQLVRANLPADKAAGTLANTAGGLAYREGYEQIDGFISKTGATQEEKKAIVSQVMENKLNRNGGAEIIRNQDTLEKARAWAATQSPDSVDQATGKILAESTRRGADFDKASALVLQYQESSGKDDALVEFLKNDTVQHGYNDKAKALIDKIKDPALQEEVRNLPQFKK
jgi:hypothetical protein